MFLSDVETASPFGEGSVSNIFYEIAGRRLSVEVETGWAARFVVAFLNGFHVEPVAPLAGAAIRLRLTVSTGETPPQLPEGLREFEVPGGVCRADTRRYFLDVAGGRVEVGAREEARVSVWLGAGTDTRRKNALITVMAYALPAALRRCGLYDLHAGGMVEPTSGSAFIFPGSSASGKTSLALRLAAAGWRYMSDDLLTISETEANAKTEAGTKTEAGASVEAGTTVVASTAVEARPLRRPFQTDAATLAGCRLPRLEEALGPPIPNDPDKRKLDPSVLFPGRLAASALPRVLCFPVIEAGAGLSRVEPLGPAEAMTRLVKMCPWSSYDLSAAREHLRLLERLVRQCRTYTLRAGRDIFDEPLEAARMLAPLARV